MGIFFTHGRNIWKVLKFHKKIKHYRNFKTSSTEKHDPAVSPLIRTLLFSDSNGEMSKVTEQMSEITSLYLC